MAKYNVYSKQIPQVSATGNDGELNIHLKCWYYAESIQDLAFNNVDDCGIIEAEKTVKFDKSDNHLMGVLKNKEITHYSIIGTDMLFPINP